jgi:hypothetical protein
MMDTSTFPNEDTKRAVIGLARDLRGLAYAFNLKGTYMMLFDWMYVIILFYIIGDDLKKFLPQIS